MSAYGEEFANWYFDKISTLTNDEVLLEEYNENMRAALSGVRSALFDVDNSEQALKIIDTAAKKVMDISNEYTSFTVDDYIFMGEPAKDAITTKLKKREINSIFSELRYMVPVSSARDIGRDIRDTLKSDHPSIYYDVLTKSKYSSLFNDPLFISEYKK